MMINCSYRFIEGFVFRVRELALISADSEQDCYPNSCKYKTSI